MVDAPTIDEQELRVAVVMNGGVSLAVWMGGVTRELDRLRRRDGAYAAIAALTRSRPRVDVIAGSSAGGINGAVLAVAIARGSDVAVIRDIWMNAGSIGDLLRDPMQREAPSLFYGDRRLLTALGSALGDVAGEGVADADGDDPLHLTVTGTMLEGEVKAYADHFGAVIPDVDHRARFVFRRGHVGEVPEADEPWPDTFTGPAVLAQIALAARSSSSFPVAFEPSFCPVGQPGPDPADHPDMEGAANFTQSRWVIDGGVLVNTPFRPALDAVATLAADVSVRRVLAYVVPHPVATTPEPDKPELLPTALEVALDAGSRIPRVQSIGRELEEISANNKRVAKRRSARSCTLDALAPGDLEPAARVLFPAYLCVRREAAVTDIIDLLLAGRRDRDLQAWREEAPARPGSERPAPWRRAPSIDEVEAVRRALRETEDVPWLPSSESAFPGSLEDWRWGLAPIEQAVNLGLDVLRTAVDLASLGDRRETIRALRRSLHAQLAALRRAARHSNEFWRSQQGVLSDPEAVRDAVEGWRPLAGEARPIAFEVASILREAADLLQPTAVPDTAVDSLRGRLATLVIPVEAEEAGPELTVRRLLALDVIQRAAGAELGGIEQTIELVLMSADTPNAFDSRARAEQKLAGLQVAHFGSFYKRSWRANDWMWGRLDGADRATRTLLDPRRIRRRLEEEPGCTPGSLLAEIQSIAVPVAGEPGSPLDDARRAWLAEGWDENAEGMLAELEELLEPGAGATSTEIPLCHEALRRRLQLEIVCDEIGGVRDAALADVAADTARNTTGARWAEQRRHNPLAGVAAIDAFKECRIGTETLAGEAGTDYFTGVATQTLGVAGSVVGGAVRWKPLTPVLNTVRGVLLTFYLLGRGVVTGSRTGNFLVALVLALGGALVGLSLLGVDVPGLLTLLGAMLLMAGVLLARVRQAGRRIVFVVVLYVATVVAYYLLNEWDFRPSWVDPVAITAAIALLATGATALGYGARQKEAEPS